MVSENPESTIFSVEIELSGDLTKREKILLFNSARKCDVSKMLSGEMNFTYDLLE